eukprot:TRINITY_DN10583_c0_g1_i1.p1 TRINITY_DN10583_c0_g1~~TRINITY_DN10583_c0_g1_i1.p1  ORF type:complete len:239 (-),score=39.25 TRINITY_DN10583_c0_g1_i1:79-795(-)
MNFLRSNGNKEPKQGIKYKIHFNKMAGLARSIESTEKGVRSYATYEIYFDGISTIFGEHWQPWNRNYENAVKIYGPTVEAGIVRQTVKVQHMQLYRNGVLRTKRGYLTDFDAFLSLLNYGLRGGKRLWYTYVIRGKKLCFSETGASFFQDFTSKHAMHSCCASSVRYAGEFHLRADENYVWKIVVDNNSGTFAPSIDDIQMLQEVIEYNIPDAVVETLAWDDPKLAEYKEIDQELGLA